jgi:hypothetical protein
MGVGEDRKARRADDGSGSGGGSSRREEVINSLDSFIHYSPSIYPPQWKQYYSFKHGYDTICVWKHD